MPVRDNPDPAKGERSHDLDAISRRLVAARAEAKALPGFPGILPETLEDAYAIQSASIARWPDSVAGWKVGGVPADRRQKYAAERLTGPIFRSSVFRVEPDSSTTMPIYSGGFAAVEAEFVIEIAETIKPTAGDFSEVRLVELVSALYIGAEIASSPMAAINKLGPACVVSDFGNNEGLLVGPPVPDWHSIPPDTLTVSVTLDGEDVGSASAASIEGGFLAVLKFLIGVSAKRGIELQKGTLVSCGALTGIHDVTVGSKARVDFGSFGAFDVAFESMAPRQ